MLELLFGPRIHQRIPLADAMSLYALDRPGESPVLDPSDAGDLAYRRGIDVTVEGTAFTANEPERHYYPIVAEAGDDLRVAIEWDKAPVTEGEQPLGFRAYLCGYRLRAIQG